MTKQSFIKGTLILLAAGIINRILGFIPRMTLPRVIGAEGVGLYQMGYPFMIVILTIITGGIPIAVAKLVAAAEAEGDEDRIRKIFRLAMLFSFILSTVFTVVSLLAANWISSHLLTDSRVYYTFICMTPIILLVGVGSVFRGYFQGRQNMIPTALSQVIETMIRIVTMLVLAYLMLPYGIEYAAAGAMVGVMLGETGALLVLYLNYRNDRKKRPKNTEATSPPIIGFRWSNLKELLGLALPITGSKLVGSCSYFLESILIVQSLAAAGIATALATAQYGALQGMVIPVLLLPSALTYSLSVSLIPSLSEAAARNDMLTIHTRLHQSLKLALVTGAPFAMIMLILAEPLCHYLYGQAQVASMLKMMAPIALFIYFQAPLQATLQALDRPGSALFNTLIGSIAKLALIYWLARKPEFGILGAIMAININIVLVTVLHWHSVVKLLHFRMQISDFAKVGLAMCVSGWASYLIMHNEWLFNTFVRFVVSCGSGIVLYLCFCVLLGLIDRNDLLRIMWLGRKIVK
ncbi:stage V sporulation protein B [Paenibacillus xerothermodurans]|uniref:Stage V sporulation protein B n=1 Tax=Paenibacillus xerothermodurans TaxID=1977292 RepID=A0A2W1NK62_PAEXE|nr:stage V sporulation protein B [Paenibacillus xerothermodurans]PZE19453.1 stage V sporulation protein B [Paenibacillus xerothermodurans]